MTDWLIDMGIIALAVARVTRMLVQENGPRNVFGGLRWLFGADNRPPTAGSWAEWWSCAWCMSLTWTIVALVCYSYYRSETIMACTVLAIAFLAGYAVKKSNR